MATTLGEGAADNRARDDCPVAFGGGRNMRGRIERDGAVVRLALVGEFDLDALADFTAALVEIEATGPRAIVVDLRGLDYMDLAGVCGLLAAQERAAGAHAFAVLDGAGPAHRLMTLVGVGAQLMVIDDASETPMARF